MSETYLAPILCALLLDGTSEERQPYSAGYDLTYVKVDCVTDTHVVEVGLDKRSSYDSLHQALFAAHLTGLTPMVVMIDTDGREGPAEYQVKVTADIAGVEYRVYDRDFLLRWQMTQWLRSYRASPGS